jgi:ribonucleoside-triphosphate reductase
LDILRILNTKGPLSYSELKTLAGFKSKKESGKFAYHLRKLVKQTLISLNRGERRYAVTSLGRLVLNLTRQIEEQSILESGRLYVRSSRQAMEEFNADKILQSLVNEAEMPVELAQKIASETEARIYKFQAAYLTAPLIREVVNSILVEHGFEEYRHKLTRLGMPVHDVSNLISQAADGVGSASTVFAHTARKVLSEYSLLTKIPRDVADAHLSGDINLSNLGTWSLMPDTVFFDLNSLQAGSFNLGSKLVHFPRLGSIKNLDSAIESFAVIAGILSSEASNEVCFDNIIPYIARFLTPRSKEEQIRLFSNILNTLSLAVNDGTARRITLRIGEPQRDEDISTQMELRDCALVAYSRICSIVPVPAVSLVLNPGRYFDTHFSEVVAELVMQGADIALESEGKYAFDGLRIDSVCTNSSGNSVDGAAILQNLTINLPRLAYESNQDETYFRAKLALVLQTALTALSSRKEQVKDVMKRGLLPGVAQLPTFSSIEDMPLVVNLAGLNDAMMTIVSDQEAANRKKIALKVLETAAKVTSEKGSKLGHKAFVSMLDHPGIERLAEIDSEKYGRAKEHGRNGYQVGLSIIYDHVNNEEILSGIIELSRATNGGTIVSFELPKTGDVNLNVSDVVTSMIGKIPFTRLSRKPDICRKCGSKIFDSTKCPNCKSTSFIPISDLN